mmetsp:Transcript_943/g.1085  ORF Transcript_943/g.1085 Transcript_943/m.1085 type:complete len:155 (+) Transcript_943:31-495(+)
MFARAVRVVSSRACPQRFVRSPFSVRSARFSTVFSKDHEWITVEDGIGTLGITDFAQNQLGDVVYVELPEVGAEFESSEAFGSVESVKAASQVYLPVSGEITEVNENLEENCALVNTAAESDGWMVKIQLSDESQLEELMDRDAYTAFCEEEAK